MPVTAQQLTLAQQAQVLPKQRRAIGEFDVRIDSQTEIYQTRTLQHDGEYSVYRIEGRQADSGTTIKKIRIQMPETSRPGVIDLSKQDDTGIQAWYSVTGGSNDFTVKCIIGTLSILGISGGPLAISGSLNANTEKNSLGQDFVLQVDFDLQSG